MFVRQTSVWTPGTRLSPTFILCAKSLTFRVAPIVIIIIGIEIRKNIILKYTTKLLCNLGHVPHTSPMNMVIIKEISNQMEKQQLKRIKYFFYQKNKELNIKYMHAI